MIEKHISPALWTLIKPLARQHRHEPTAAEHVLWQHLHNRQCCGVKFRRQHSIERFIVDFAALRPRLVIEVDGPIHDYTPEQDAIRQQYIEAIGFRVLRFSNDDVLNDCRGVLTAIEHVLTHTPRPKQPDRTT
jgi:very-short-patch-repair endonuclease